MKRRSSTEREAAKLAEAFARASSELQEQEANLRTVEEAAERTRREAGLAKAVGEIDVVEYVSRTEKATALEAETRAARDQAGAVLEAVRGPAADAHEALANARVESAISDVDERSAALADAERVVEEQRRSLSVANDRLAIEQRRAVDARAPFDPAVAAKAAERAAQDEEHVNYYAPRPERDAEVSVHLVERVLERRAAGVAAAEEENARLAEHPDRVRPEEVFSDGGLRPGQPFPRLPMPGDRV